MTTKDHLPRPDVPAPIAVVRDFVNTTDHEDGTDELTTKAELSRYLLREGLLPRCVPGHGRRPGAGAAPARGTTARARAEP